MNRVIVSFATISLAFSAVACGSDDNGNGNQGTTGGTSQTPGTGGATASGTGGGTATGGSSTVVHTGGTSSIGVVTGGTGNTTGGTTSTTTTGGTTGTTGGTTSTTGGTTSTTGGTTGTTGGTTGTTGGTTGTASGGTGGVGDSGGTTGSSGGTDNLGGDTGSTGETGGMGDGGTSATTGGAGGSEPVGGTGGTTEPPTILTVQLDNERQIIRGFGINATIMPDNKSLPWEQLFTLEGENGLGLSILRIGMKEDGTHRSVPNDWTTVRQHGARVIGSCWSAPADWKTNSSTTAGGHLKPEYYRQWAERIATYAKTNDLYAMSIGNETDFASCSSSGAGKACNPPLTDEYESMVYTGEELANFVAIAGEVFDEMAPDIKVMAPEASIWLHVWSTLSPTNKANGGYDSSDPLGCGCYSNDIDDEAALATCDPKCITGNEGYDYGHWLAKNETAWNGFDILGVHEYESQKAYAWPADVTGGVRTKEVWQTEMSGVMYWPEQGPSTDIKNGIAVARWMHSGLTVGEASAWLYWWYEAYYQNDNEGLALIQGSNTIAKRYYTFGNFSRYIRPDVFHAVQMAGPSPDKVLVSAYEGDGGEVVIVAINETNQAVEIPIAITGGTAPASLTPHVTSESANWEAGTAVTVTDGTFTASLPGMSVTTFVSG